MLVTLNRDLIFEDLGINDLNSDQKEIIWQVMLDIFQTKIIERMLSLLSEEEDKRQFLLLLTDQADEELLEFLNSKINNPTKELEKVVAEVCKDFKTDVYKARKESNDNL